jgi:hypothetical protein
MLTIKIREHELFDVLNRIFLKSEKYEDCIFKNEIHDFMLKLCESSLTNHTFLINRETPDRFFKAVKGHEGDVVRTYSASFKNLGDYKELEFGANSFSISGEDWLIEANITCFTQVTKTWQVSFHHNDKISRRIKKIFKINKTNS